MNNQATGPRIVMLAHEDAKGDRSEPLLPLQRISTKAERGADHKDNGDRSEPRRRSTMNFQLTTMTVCFLGVCYLYP